MRYLPVLLLLICMDAAAQRPYFQQRTDYRIDVSLDAAAHTLDGYEVLQYTNASPDTLHFIWFHLWPNAYKNDRTAMSDQMLLQGDTRFYFSDAPDRGYINRLQFMVDGQAARTEDHPEHIDIIRLWLPKPLLPGATAKVTTPFHVKLPYNFSRGGHVGNNIQATQWYPKPAVYDRDGWHPMPYLLQGEYYSEFGSFDVRVSVPSNYLVAGTGALQEPVQQDTSFRNAAPVKKPASNTKASSTKVSPLPEKTYPPQTWHFRQDSVHDFAWFASPAFRVTEDTCMLPSGRIISVSSFFTKARSKEGAQSLQFAKNAVRFYSAAVGEYPYNTLRIVEGPKGFKGGMEYPTITLIAPDMTGQNLDVVIAHEVGHNWFYGILASNERDHPWMDEGINSYIEKAYTKAYYKEEADEEAAFLQQQARLYHDQPVATASEKLTAINYGLITYYKTATWMQWIERQVGPAAMNAFMHDYYARWSFRHPAPEDLFALMQQHFGERAEAFRNAVYAKGLLPGQSLKGFALLTPVKPRSFERYMAAPSKNALVIGPAFGYNVYDKLMAGVMLTNYKIPSDRFRYFLAPMYATGSKQATGLGRIGYSTYSKKGTEAEGFLTASSFSYNEFKADDGITYRSRFTKLAPGIEVKWKGSDPLSTREKWIRFTSYFIGEQPLRITYDSVITPIDTTEVQVVQKRSLKYSVHQLRIGMADTRALYPWSAQVELQGATQFARLGFEGHYFFNYRKGGLRARLFAGAFFYDDAKRYDYGYNISRFMLNMTGANGEEDYTYQHYFVGRNRFEGFSSRQIAMRDGGFKVRTDLLADKVGKSAKWLTALNLNTTIPDKMNPLSALPVKIPLLLFADIGTYGEAWEQGARTDRFLFDGGLQLSLFSGTVNFYLPLVYSSQFSDYVKMAYEKNRLFRNMSFSINLDVLNRNIKRQMLF